MRNFGPLPVFSLLIFTMTITAAAITLACGSSQHLLQTVSVSPATADAKNYPDGQVQFTATGYYNMAPSPVVPFGATWGTCSQPAPGQEQSTNAVTVNSNGVAQCTKGAVGTYTVWASGSNPLKPGTVCSAVITACGVSCDAIVGNAQLTCP
jgi:hypothetical protein